MSAGSVVRDPREVSRRRFRASRSGHVAFGTIPAPVLDVSFAVDFVAAAASLAAATWSGMSTRPRPCRTRSFAGTSVWISATGAFTTGPVVSPTLRASTYRQHGEDQHHHGGDSHPRPGRSRVGRSARVLHLGGAHDLSLRSVAAHLAALGPTVGVGRRKVGGVGHRNAVKSFTPAGEGSGKDGARRSGGLEGAVRPPGLVRRTFYSCPEHRPRSVRVA